MPKGLRSSQVTCSSSLVADSFARTQHRVCKNDNSYTQPNFELGIHLLQGDIHDPIDIQPVVVEIVHFVVVDRALCNDSIVDVDCVLVDIDLNVVSAHRMSKHPKNCKIMVDGSPMIYITPSRSLKRVVPFVNNASTRASTSYFL